MRKNCQMHSDRAKAPAQKRRLKPPARHHRGVAAPQASRANHSGRARSRSVSWQSQPSQFEVRTTRCAKHRLQSLPRLFDVTRLIRLPFGISRQKGCRGRAAPTSTIIAKDVPALRQLLLLALSAAWSYWLRVSSMRRIPGRSDPVHAKSDRQPRRIRRPAPYSTSAQRSAHGRSLWHPCRHRQIRPPTH